MAAWLDTARRGNPPGKPVVAALVALVSLVGVYGLAASLGSSSTGLGAGSTVTASCGDGMTIAYTTAFHDAGYAVNALELSDIPAGCRSKSFSATFYDRSGVAVGAAVDATLTASGATQRVAVDASSNTIDAGEVSGVSVVVS